MADHHHHHQHSAHDEAGLAEMLDLDAEVLHAYVEDVTAWLQQLTAEDPPRRVVDLGAGTGTGTLMLARAFPAAEVAAVDASGSMLDRIRHRAQKHSLTHRIRTIEADLDAGWPQLDQADLVWASNSMHHLADPERALGDILATLRPGGLLVVAEVDKFPRFFRQSALEDRLHEAQQEVLGERMPRLGVDWEPLVAKAGFTVTATRHFSIELTSPLPSATPRYAQATLQRLRSALGDKLTADEVTALDRLLSDGPESVLTRDDLVVRADRSIVVGTRP